MRTSILNSMSVKKLSARLFVLLVVCAFATSAKALVAQPTYMDGGMGFIIQLESSSDNFNGGSSPSTATYDDPAINPNNCVQGVYMDGATGDLFLRYQSPGGAPGNVWLSEITKAQIRTADDVTLSGTELDQLKNSYPNLAYLDFENASVDNSAWGNLNSMSQLRTLVFPKADGLVIPSGAFKYNEYLETVVFPDREGNGTYQIMSYAFLDSSVETVSLGKGFSIPDFSQGDDGTGSWRSESGSGTSIFEHCTELVNVILDNSITALGEKMFSACYNMEYLILPEELQHIGYLCFKECGIRTVTIPDKVDLTGNSDQIFQGCIRLTNLYVNSDVVRASYQSLMENAQTMSFQRTATSTTEYSISDYTTTRTFTSSDYVNDKTLDDGHVLTKSPFQGQTYTCPVLHYPGTVTAIENYRLPKYMHYTGVDQATGTTWPANSSEVSPYEPLTVGSTNYLGWSYQNDEQSIYGGWRQFPIGNNIFKEQSVFIDERIKESRWYSICLPINMTEGQFMTAYGVGAALHEFSGAVYDPDKKAIILQFNTPATADANGILLKKNTPYMIHPAKVKLTKIKTITTHSNGTVVDGVEFVKTSGGDFVTKEAVATYDVDNDLFIKWDILLYGTDPVTGTTLDQAKAQVISDTNAALASNAVTYALDASLAPAGQKPLPADFTFKGSYLGAELYAPTTVKVGDSPLLPVGAFYLGKDGNNPPAFYKAKGNGVWSPYCALIESSSPSGGAGAKEFDMLDFDFNNMTDYMVETGIGAPTIQIPIIKTDSKIYNLNGQVIRESSKDTNGLKGIFIVGGKKVIFK